MYFAILQIVKMEVMKLIVHSRNVSKKNSVAETVDASIIFGNAVCFFRTLTFHFGYFLTMISELRTDGEDDCQDGSDETQCHKEASITCKSDEFTCKSTHQCIPQSWVCDNEHVSCEYDLDLSEENFY